MCSPDTEMSLDMLDNWDAEGGNLLAMWMVWLWESKNLLGLKRKFRLFIEEVSEVVKFSDGIRFFEGLMLEFEELGIKHLNCLCK